MMEKIQIQTNKNHSMRFQFAYTVTFMLYYDSDMVKSAENKNHQ